MKKIIISLLVLIMGFWVLLFSQVENEAVALGLPGDNLNLYAVLDVFKIQKQWRNSKEQLILEMLILII
jgi:hypothetical protein